MITFALVRDPNTYEQLYAGPTEVLLTEVWRDARKGWQDVQISFSQVPTVEELIDQWPESQRPDAECLIRQILRVQAPAGESTKMIRITMLRRLTALGPCPMGLKEAKDFVECHSRSY